MIRRSNLYVFFSKIIILQEIMYDVVNFYFFIFLSSDIGQQLYFILIFISSYMAE